MNGSSLKDTRPHTISFVFLVFAALLFLAASNFINKYFYFLFALFAVFFLFYAKSISFTPTVIVLCALTVSFLLFDTIMVYSFNSMIKQLVYPLSYLFGLNCIKVFVRPDGEQQKSREQLFLLFCVVISLGIFFHVSLNLYSNWGSENRNIIDFWAGNLSSATCNAALFCFGVGMLPALLLNKTTKRLKLFAVLMLVVFLLFALLLAGRTFFALFAATFLLVFFYYLFSVHNCGKVVKSVLVIAIALLALYLLYTNNVFGLKNFVEESNMFQRFFSDNAQLALGEDTRIDKKMQYLAQMGNYLWGGGKLRDAVNGSYAHELYLDTYSRAGIIAYVLLIWFVASRTVCALRLVFTKKYSVFINCLILGLFISINVEFFIEPIVEGVPWLLPIFCLLCGMVDYLRLCETKPAPALRYLYKGGNI